MYFHPSVHSNPALQRVTGSQLPPNLQGTRKVENIPIPPALREGGEEEEGLPTWAKVGIGLGAAVALALGVRALLK